MLEGQARAGRKARGLAGSQRGQGQGPERLDHPSPWRGVGEPDRRLGGSGLHGVSGCGKEACGARGVAYQLQAQRHRGEGEKTARVRAEVLDLRRLGNVWRHFRLSMQSVALSILQYTGLLL